MELNGRGGGLRGWLFTGLFLEPLCLLVWWLCGEITWLLQEVMLQYQVFAPLGFLGQCHPGLVMCSGVALLFSLKPRLLLRWVCGGEGLPREEWV